ncbi:MAG: S8 family serine peptidase [Verrucomicrobiota bacterium]
MKKGFTLLFLAGVFSLQAGDLDIIGVTVLRQVDPTLTGSGVEVAQPEAPVSTDTPPPFEVNPAAVGQRTNLFTWISSIGARTVFTNNVGAESWHADIVGENFYGVAGGAATNVGHVYNYEAYDFFNEYIDYPGTSIPVRVVNQSFILVDPSEELRVNTNYDNYAARYGTIFVSGIAGTNNFEPICAPGSCYNGIGVGAYYAFSLPGPTDDGRCKPDIIAPDLAQYPEGAVSYATPYACGSAAILVQAANRGDGGANTNAAGDLRTIKALLLNGAVKPNDWTNGTATPLDPRYGAGMVNVFNSWEQLKGGQHAFIESSSVGSGGAHPPGANTNNEPTLVGWDYNTNSTTTTSDTVNHYYFNLPGSNVFTLTATLVWNKQYKATNINNLNLFLYRAADGNLITCSTSLVDNVEHIFQPTLPSGRYDLQVLKSGSATQVSAAETYALAFEIFNLPLSVRLTNSNAVISWPVAPTGFQLQSATSLAPPVSWTSVTNAVSIANNQNVVTLPVGSGSQFFRLIRPAF